jgi:photosystem II stability/assembly factor-like uncharacterized protein
MKLKVIIFGFVPVSALLLAGCASGDAVGIFRSTDGGNTFTESSHLDIEDTVRGDRIASLANHPTRAETIFAGLAERGVVVSKDGGVNWQSTMLLSGTAHDIAVHPQTATIVYFAYDQQVIRTTDDGVTFETMYTDPSVITSISIDPAAPANIWIGTASGQVVHSSNEGRTWNVAASFISPVNDVLVSPLGSAIVVATDGAGVAVSADRGKTFTVRTPTKNTTDTLTSDAENGIALAQSAQPASPLLYATREGLLSSKDLGLTWTQVPTPLSASQNEISQLSVAANNNSQVILLAGNQIAKSDDGGVSWQTRTLPTGRTLGAVAVVNPQTIVIGISGEGPGFVERTLGR